MYQRWRSLSFLVACLISPSFAAIPQRFENTAIVRTVELGGSLVHVTTTYAARAIEADSKVYIVALGPDEKAKTSFIEANVRGQKKPLKVEEYGFDDNDGLYYLGIYLPKPQASNSTIHLVLETVQTHATRPWPEAAPQSSEQGMKYDTSALVLSPYHTVVQRTKVKGSNPRILSYDTPEKLDSFIRESVVTKSGSTITYGPFYDLAASSNKAFVKEYQEPITIHYNYELPVLEVKKLVRTAEISHWGSNLNIQDEVALHNAGPSLSGHFSRLEHQTQNFYKRPAPHVLTSWAMHLPAGIRNTYFYDAVGNISTSRLRVAPSTPKGMPSKPSVLELKPRYPVMGGWNFSYTVGWDAPLEDSVVWDNNKKSYIVAVPVWTVLAGAVVDDAEVTIIFPEGATTIEDFPPFPPVDTKLSTHTTFLDTTGRPTITFKYKDLTDRHAQIIYVAYKVPTSAHFKKPLAVATAFFTLFALALAGRRVNLQIHSKTA